jgi:hypothetical protein
MLVHGASYKQAKGCGSEQYPFRKAKKPRTRQRIQRICKSTEACCGRWGLLMPHGHVVIGATRRRSLRVHIGGWPLEGAWLKNGGSAFHCGAEGHPVC